MDGQNNRSWPGAGGAVGGFSEPGANTAKVAGAGPVYYSYTPSLVQAPSPEEPFPNEPGPIPRGPDDFPIPQIPGGGGFPTTPTTPGGGSDVPAPTRPPVVTQFPQGQGGSGTSIWDAILQLMAPGKASTFEARPPLFIYNPSATAGSSGGGTMRILVIVGVIAAGWFLYKKYA